MSVLKRVAIIGSGGMAFTRGKAFLDTGMAQIIGIASRNIEHAKNLAKKLNVKNAFNDYHNLVSLNPDVLLIEVPHYVLGEIVMWGIESAKGILVGSPLVDNSKGAEEIEKRAKEKGCLVEAGYEARYDAVWERTKEIIGNKEIGEPVMVQSLALYSTPSSSWYYREKESGGMPLTHMTYCFINPVRWVLGRIIEVSASANQLLHRGEEFVKEEMCSSTFRFQNGCLYSAVAGYISPGSGFPNWWVKFVCTDGGLEVFPSKNLLKVYKKGGIEEIDLSSKESPFLRQAKNFLGALDGKGNCLNLPKEAVIDVKIAEAIVRSARNHAVIKIE